MKIIRNYILEEIFSNFWSILLILTFVLLVGRVFTKMIDLIINHGVDILLMCKLILFSVPFLFTFTIPMAVLVAVLLTCGRLSADHELVALRASGISLRRIIWPVITSTFLISLFTLYLHDQIASKSHFKVRQLTAELGMKSPSAMLEEGVFIKTFKNIIIFVHRIDENKLHQIRIYQPQDNGPTRTIIAEEGELIPVPEQNIIKLKLINGTSDEPDASQPGGLYKLKFETFYLPLDVSNLKSRRPLDKKRKELTLKELWGNYTRLKGEGFIDNYALTSFHKRIAMALSTFVLVIIGIPLAITTRRGEKSIGFAIAIILSTAYWVLLIGMSHLSKSGKIDPWMVMHFPNFLFLIIGSTLLQKHLRS